MAFKLMVLSAFAATPTVPSSADAGRIKPEESLTAPVHSKGGPISVPSGGPLTPIPAEAESIHFVLKFLNIKGATAYTQDDLKSIYAPLLGKDTTLAEIYRVSNKITTRYREAGYFLSRSYIPAQDITDGTVTINVVEGYIGEVGFADKRNMPGIIQDYAHKLLEQRPLKAQSLESFLLRINDLPGMKIQGVLSALPNTEGAARLTLQMSKTKGSTHIGFDNASSRYLGPNEVSASWSGSVIEGQQTSISVFSGIPGKKLKAGSVGQSIAIAPDFTLDLAGSYTHSQPGYTLRPFEVISSSNWVGVGLAYQIMRQRQENLSVKLTMDGRNTKSDILSAPLTRDRIRALRLNMAWDKVDSMNGRNNVNLTLSQGLAIFGASKKGQANLSRASAQPDFTKAELSISRLQEFGPKFSLLASGNAQAASTSLYSAEQFGYGGSSFGRAFDASELTGDQGMVGAIELRYDGWAGSQPVALQPYAFYDIGKVWSRGIAGDAGHQTGASFGIGSRAVYQGFNADLGLAWPLARNIQVPIYGQNASGPRILVRIGQAF